ncbi:MAG: hypothetical protein HC767_05105 [Akkermansiaceae bacterium]|nr:hypothetical protein [Akkermansiaceae bacterium]
MSTLQTNAPLLMMEDSFFQTEDVPSHASERAVEYLPAKKRPQFDRLTLKYTGPGILLLAAGAFENYSMLTLKPYRCCFVSHREVVLHR